MADGGDGTVEAFLAGGARARRLTVTGPLGAPVEADVRPRRRAGRDRDGGRLGPGPARPAPTRAGPTTRGTGELLRDALDGGATADRARHRRQRHHRRRRRRPGRAGRALPRRRAAPSWTRTPEALVRLDRVDLERPRSRARAAPVDLAVACDVDNPLLGPHGRGGGLRAAERREPGRRRLSGRRAGPAGRRARRGRRARAARGARGRCGGRPGLGPGERLRSAAGARGGAGRRGPRAGRGAARRRLSA